MASKEGGGFIAIPFYAQLECWRHPRLEHWIRLQDPVVILLSQITAFRSDAQALHAEVQAMIAACAMHACAIHGQCNCLKVQALLATARDRMISHGGCAEECGLQPVDMDGAVASYLSYL